jgi:hypothetical protein
MLRRRRRNSLSWSYRPLEPTSWAAVGYSPDPMTFAVCTTDQIKKLNFSFIQRNKKPHQQVGKRKFVVERKETNSPQV